MSGRGEITVTVQYYAMLREERGVTSESIETTAASPSDLYDDLRRRHGFGLEAARLKVVVNDEFCTWDHPLQSGDVVVFIPPVAGG